MKPQIQLTSEWMNEARQWAERSVAGYKAGNKPRSQAMARPGIDKSLDAQQLGKMGEVAFCLYLGIDPKVLNWSAIPDDGWDVMHLGLRIDVKATDTNHLIWPITKHALLEQRKCDALVLVRRMQPDLFEISGWMSLRHFIDRHHVAPPPNGFDPGTKYRNASELWEIERLSRAQMAIYCAELAIRYQRQQEYVIDGWPFYSLKALEASRASFVGYDDKGHFIHYCACGKWGSHGRDARLRNGRLGTWYCDEHVKDYDNGKSTAREEDRAEGSAAAGGARGEGGRQGHREGQGREPQGQQDQGQGDEGSLI